MLLGQLCEIFDRPILEMLKVIKMQLDELAPVLEGVKEQLGTVSDTLATVAADQAEASTEILEALDALKPLVPANAVALLTDIQTALGVITGATDTVGTQAKALADIIPDSPTPPPPAP